MTLSGKTLLITGASRGIGRAIALRCAREGANIVIAAKSVKPHPKLGGSIYEVAEEVEQAGGKALALGLDVRDEHQVAEVMAQAAQHFGGLDALVNNAGAISLTPVEHTPVKLYDRMLDINARAVFVCAQAALPYLKQSANGHILSLSPPLNLDRRWLDAHAPYTLSKYGMTMLSLGMAGEFASYGIAVNTLWPRTIIATAAIEFALGSKDSFDYCRTPEIMADAAHAILSSPSRELTGQNLLDEDFLRGRGVTDFGRYAYNSATADQIQTDLFVDGYQGIG
ncbi:MAG: NAD(P)-dependent oxidoreductase [Gammaproteobacteria bacterium]|nr:NAD(P)-dependent oxidoreductase [Gammaproteobacteria bacterium]